MIEVKDIELSNSSNSRKLVEQLYSSGGFTAKKVGEGTRILGEMIEEKNCLRFLSFPADIIATGTRGVVRKLIEQRLFDIVVTTCGTLDHDISRTFKPYFHGFFEADDAALYKKGFHRLGNIFIPIANHGPVIERVMQKVLANLWRQGKRELASYELVWEIGNYLMKNKQAQKNLEKSIIYWATKNKIPVVIPGITDGAAGTQIYLFSQDRDFKVNVLKDEKLLAREVLSAKKSGALIIGGGISKHHVIWWNQFRKGLDYAVQITTAPEWDGSLSGARTREAISWGKIKEKAKHVTIEGDATVLLPLMCSALLK